MAKVKLELQKKSDVEMEAFCQNHINKMAGNEHFSEPEPSEEEYQAHFDAFKGQLATVTALENQLASARALLRAYREKLELETTGRGNYVETKAKKDAAKILSAGFEVRGTAAPIGELPAPINFLAKMGAQSGQILLTWKKVHGASSYVIHCREHDVAGAAWEQVKIVTAAKLKVESLVPGKNYAFRVRAVGAAGESPWSDESVKMAP
ncbi:MAG: fibronectin type III domain-containing protein [Akkermansiaceae bacterium]|nr:fibronectin type III domain-containing protein [Akkermansiaceae bacterium]